MTSNYTILIVEDEKNISDVIKAYMEKEGFHTITAFDGEEAMELFQKEEVSLILLDLMIPKIPGEEICSRIRKTSDVPVIMLTAKSDENSRIDGLDMGADDYVVKPFSPRELVSRVNALLRRSYRDQPPLNDLLSLKDGLKIDKKKFQATKNGEILNLTGNEFKILISLVENQGMVFTREQLIENSLGLDFDGYDRTIDTYIKNIRQKIEEDPKKPKYIKTIYGVGYKFEG